ncbi:MAG TPA: Gfo/Idh/MocA family oxidoreductase [Bacteroidota bacterium]
MSKNGKVAWGVLSTARIGVGKVIPSMMQGQYSDVVAICSRDVRKAQSAAHQLGIPKAYGSYEELIADPGVEAVYIPLPNHMHVPWAVKCLEAGKHVLCEKPLAMNAREAEDFEGKTAQFPNLKVMEAFMYRFHPQWEKVRGLLREGAIGTVRWMHSHFLYNNTNPNDIRNRPETGGGGLLDIGCYCISVSRLLFEDEPTVVRGVVDIDPATKTDRLVSAILEFRNGMASFSCSTKALPGQGTEIVGTDGRIKIELPFTPPPDMKARIVIDRGSGKQEEIAFEPCNQYTLQGDAFSRAILRGTQVPTPLSDGIQNMRVIDRIRENSGGSNPH